MSETVAVVGASNDESRYAYKAMALLMERGHRVIPVTPRSAAVQGVPAVARLADIDVPVDTVTVYVRPAVVRELVPDLTALGPGRVIFNPGTEDAEAMSRLREAGIAVIEACTIVMQKTGVF